MLSCVLAGECLLPVVALLPCGWPPLCSRAIAGAETGRTFPWAGTNARILGKLFFGGGVEGSSSADVWTPMKALGVWWFELLTAKTRIVYLVLGSRLNIVMPVSTLFDSPTGKTMSVRVELRAGYAYLLHH